MKKLKLLVIIMLCMMSGSAGFVVQAGQETGNIRLVCTENTSGSLTVVCEMKGIQSFTNGKLRIFYDAEQLILRDVEIGTLLDRFHTVVNDPVTGTKPEGEIVLAFASAAPSEGNGSLLTLYFDKKDRGKPADITLQAEELANSGEAITAESASLHVEDPNSGPDQPGGDSQNGGGERPGLPGAKKSITGLKVKAPSKKVYNRKKQKPAVKVYDGKTLLKKGTDYTLSYKKNKKAGRAYIYIRGAGRYTGTRRVSFYIVTKKQKILRIGTPGKGQIRLRWKYAGQSNGYQVQYARNKSFTKGRKKLLVKGKRSRSKTIKNCKSGKMYFVRVRSYKRIGGKRIYGPYSKIRRIRVK